MEKIATYLRFLQLYAHICHNLVSGPTFFADHEFLGELYPAYEGEYDSVVERMIGLGMKPNLFAITKDAAAMLDRVGNKNINEAFKNLLKIEKLLCDVIEKEVTPSPMAHPHTNMKQGTIQMLGNIADASEVRQYKMNQRISD